MIVAALLAASLSHYTPEQIPFLAAAAALQSARAATVTPEFRGAALEAQETTSHEWVLAGPAETGKTFAGLWRVDSELRRVPRSRWVIVRKVRADMGSTVMNTWARVSGLRGAPIAYGGQEPEWFDYPNGSRLYVAGMDRPGKVLSGEYDGIYVNQLEELRLADFETLTTRCTGRGVQTDTPMLCGDCNPGPPNHWILGRKALKVFHSRHEDNPTLWDGSAWTEQGKRSLAILDSLTGVRKDRLRFGRWLGAEGAVYEEFDRGLHVIKRFEIPADWRRFRSIDLGYTNPFVCQWWALDPDGRAYLYREIYRTGRLVEDHARDIKALSEGEKIEATIADHDAEDRATLERHGVGTIPAFKSVTVGIQAVQRRLQKANDGKPRMFVLEGSLVSRDSALADAYKPTCTEEEFEVYVWAKAADGKPLKEEPAKAFDHGMDAARYFVAHVDGISDRKHAGFLDLIRSDLASKGGKAA